VFHVASKDGVLVTSLEIRGGLMEHSGPMYSRDEHSPLDRDGDYFAGDYQQVMYTGAVGYFSRLTHRLMDRPFRSVRTPVVLEVGAGAGQHANYAETDFDRYYITDISAEVIGHYAGSDERMIARVADAENLIDFADESVDRVVATCLLAHLTNPETALNEWRRVVKPGGNLSIYVPAEPGMLLRLLRHVAVVPKARKIGNDHLAIVYRHHRNHYPSMKTIITSVFAEDNVIRKRFPTRLLGWNFSLFEIYHITKCDV